MRYGGTFIGILLYSVLKNLVLPRKAGSSMGHACPALGGGRVFRLVEPTPQRARPEIDSFAMEFCG